MTEKGLRIRIFEWLSKSFKTLRYIIAWQKSVEKVVNWEEYDETVGNGYARAGNKAAGNYRKNALEKMKLNNPKIWSILQR